MSGEHLPSSFKLYRRASVFCLHDALWACARSGLGVTVVCNL
jgi:hypothetical protein